LPLYKEAGCLRFLLGLEGTDEATLATLKKGGTRSKDRQAIDLLRQNGMIGLCTFAVGFAEERDADYARLLRQLLHYDPDQVMSIYATPHRWTPFYGAVADREVIQPDIRRWDYKHQVMRVPGVPAWRVFLWVKLIELVLQLRPRALWRNWLHPDPEVCHAMRWYTRMGRGVILSELADFLWRAPRKRVGSVATFLGGETQLDENAMDNGRPKASVAATQNIAQHLL
jgi:anaerobic magnesium-protoporphyrin IX monomethyl ester cyclase